MFRVKWRHSNLLSRYDRHVIDTLDVTCRVSWQGSIVLFRQNWIGLRKWSLPAECICLMSWWQTFLSFTHNVAVKTSRHRYGTKLHHSTVTLCIFDWKIFHVLKIGVKLMADRAEIHAKNESTIICVICLSNQWFICYYLVLFCCYFWCQI